MAQPNTQYSQAQILGMIDAQGKSYGLSADQIGAAKTVAIAEGAGGQQIGDNGTSFGPFQFHAGGMLDGFASWLGGVSLDQAATTANTRPDLAIQYALEHGGYLSQAIQAGTAAGHAGLNLALYAEQFGQRAAQSGGQLIASVYANVVNAWSTLTGGGVTSVPSGDPAPFSRPPDPTFVGPGTDPTDAVPSPAPDSPPWSLAPGIAVQVPAWLTKGQTPGTTTEALAGVGSSIAATAQGIAGIPTAINNAISEVFTGVIRIGWIVLGLFIATVGLYLLTRE